MSPRSQNYDSNKKFSINPLQEDNLILRKIERLKQLREYYRERRRNSRCDEFHIIQLVLGIYNNIKSTSRKNDFNELKKKILFPPVFQIGTIKDTYIFDNSLLNCNNIHIQMEIQYIFNKKLVLKNFDITINEKDIDKLFKLHIDKN